MLRKFAPLLLLLILVSCTTSPTPTGVLRTPVPPSSKPTNTIQLATVALRPSATNTPSPTADVLRTTTSAPVPKPTLTRVPRPTPGSTLTNDEEQTLVLDLLKENGGCRLPCWWGFSPGKTDWLFVQNFLASSGKIAMKFSNSYLTNYTVKFVIPQHDVQLGQVYNVTNGFVDMIWVSANTVRNHQTIYGDTQFAKDLQPYALPQMLDVYGRPTEVFLKTYSSTPEGWIPFQLLLFYQEQGILVRYYGPALQKGQQIMICPQQSDITLWLWSPERTMNLEDIANMGQDFPIEEVPEFRHLEEATGVSVEQFYQSFVQPHNRTCLETPIDMW
jgi:hypothetical protein